MKKIVAILLVLILAIGLCGCDLSEKELEEGIRGDWYSSTMPGGLYFRYNFKDGEFTQYSGIKGEEGNDVKVVSGTYKIKGYKIKVDVDFAEERLGFTENDFDNDRKIIVKDGKVTGIKDVQMVYTRKTPNEN